MQLLKNNPYDFNSVSLKITRDNQEGYLPQADVLIVNPLYNKVGKFLGIDTVREWNDYYDKVYRITQWAKTKAKSNDVNEIINVITQKANQTPTMNQRRVTDIFIACELDSNKVEPVKETKPEEPKEEIKSETTTKEEVNKE